MKRSIFAFAFATLMLGACDGPKLPYWVTATLEISCSNHRDAKKDHERYAMVGCGPIGFSNETCELEAEFGKDLAQSTGLKFDEDFKYTVKPGVSGSNAIFLQVAENGVITNDCALKANDVDVSLSSFNEPIKGQAYAFKLVEPSDKFPEGIQPCNNGECADKSVVKKATEYSLVITTATTTVNVIVEASVDETTMEKLTSNSGATVSPGVAYSADVKYDTTGSSKVLVGLYANGTVNVIGNGTTDKQYKLYASVVNGSKSVLLDTHENNKLCLEVNGGVIATCGVDLVIKGEGQCVDNDLDGACVNIAPIDCNDNNDTVAPVPYGAEITGNGIDDDCNALTFDDPDADDDGDGVTNGTDSEPLNPCVPGTANDACQATIDADGDGTSVLTDSDDNDPCVPSATVNACKATIDVDGDGDPALTDPDDNDPCNPLATTTACKEITDNDGDEVNANDDLDDNDACNPDPNDPLCTVADPDNDHDGTPVSSDPDDTNPCVPSAMVNACLATIDLDGDEVFADSDPDDTDACNPDPNDPLCVVPPVIGPLPVGYTYGAILYPALTTGRFLCSQAGDGSVGTMVDLPHAWGDECVEGVFYAHNPNPVDFNIHYGGNAWAIAFGTQAEFDRAPPVWVHVGNLSCNVMQFAFRVPNYNVAGYHGSYKVKGIDTDNDGHFDTNIKITTTDDIVICQ